MARKIVVQMSVTVDGYHEGPNRDISWHRVDEEFNRYAIGTLRSADTILFGRVTYELFRDYWPAALTDPKTSPRDLEIARLLDEMEKVVYSRTLKDPGWRRARVVREVIKGDIEALKAKPGGDMHVGGATLARRLMELGLIDEWRLIVSPLVLGAGSPLFPPGVPRTPLQLLDCQRHASGNVILTYRPQAAGDDA